MKRSNHWLNTTCMNYNLQPYGKDGDSKGFRTVEWYKAQVAYPLLDRLNYLAIASSVLDVGVGNGRLIPIFNVAAKRYLAIDPVCTPDKANLGDAEFQKIDFMNVKGEFHYILFMASFWIIWKNYQEKAIEKLASLLTGKAAILCSIKNEIPNFFNYMQLFSKVEMCRTEDGTSVIIVVEK